MHVKTSIINKNNGDGRIKLADSFISINLNKLIKSISYLQINFKI